MHQLTSQQKVENLMEINRKLQNKKERLQKQIDCNKAKIDKLSKAEKQAISSSNLNFNFGGNFNS